MRLHATPNQYYLTTVKRAVSTQCRQCGKQHAHYPHYNLKRSHCFFHCIDMPKIASRDAKQDLSITPIICWMLPPYGPIMLKENNNKQNPGTSKWLNKCSKTITYPKSLSYNNGSLIWFNRKKRHMYNYKIYSTVLLPVFLASTQKKSWGSQDSRKEVFLAPCYLHNGLLSDGSEDSSWATYSSCRASYTLFMTGLHISLSGSRLKRYKFATPGNFLTSDPLVTQLSLVSLWPA